MDAESNAEPQIFMKHDTRLHGGSSKKEVLTSEYLRKFIIYVRRRWERALAQGGGFWASFVNPVLLSWWGGACMI
eukprot:1149775-Pelagomonas_calceolata.AAC.10